MFSDDEDELELLRQYGDRDLHAEDSEGHSSDDMDSDLEDKIMSMVQYGSGLAKKTPLTTPKEPEVVHDIQDDEDKKSTSATFSTADELGINEENSDDDGVKENESDSDEDVGVPELPVTPKQEELHPQVTRYINLDEKHYVEDEVTDEEEAELNSKLQELIDNQISKRQRGRTFTRPIRTCFSCHQPGHERKDCTVCGDCGGPKHSDSRCPGAKYCARCKRRGHMAADCEFERDMGNCRICHMTYHNAVNCPSLLHVYEDEIPSKKIPVAYCYYCTAKGHYGDDCPHLPPYLTNALSVFTQLSLSEGSRFDPKKSLKSSASSFSKKSSSSSSHQRWSDSSRDSSPQRGHHNDRSNNSYNKKRRNNDSDDSYYGSQRRNDNSRYDSRQDYSRRGNTSYQDNSAGGKRRRTDYDSRSSSKLDNFFTKESSSSSKTKNQHNGNHSSSKSGNSNWKAMNNSTLPQPTRSGTVDLNKGKGRQQHQKEDYSGDFPRGNNNGDLPRPSSSGVIDLTKDNENGYSKRGPKYSGGYKRR